MRVQGQGQPPAEKPKSKSFQAELKKASLKPAGAKLEPKAEPSKPALPPKQAAAKLDAVLARSQKAASKFSSALAERRAEAEVHRPEVKVVAQKLAAILSGAEERPREQPKSHEPAPQPSPVALAPQNPNAPPAPQPLQAPARAERLAGQIETLIERAELLARAEGPALQLGLSEGRAAQVEVVRTGKGEVTLRLQARTPSDRRALASQVSAIRAALAERGLKVRDVRVG